MTPRAATPSPPAACAASRRRRWASCSPRPARATPASTAPAGRAPAKRAALALRGLVRGRFPEDTLEAAGFFTYAVPLTEWQLLHAAPKPVSQFEPRVLRRVPLAALPADLPEHFTNIQAGLRLARLALRRHSVCNKQIVCVTDGEPTAYLEGGQVVLVYPPTERTVRATLEEVERCRGEGIAISPFALTEETVNLGLMNFVDQMARRSRGKAVYCAAGQLGRLVLDSYLDGRRTRNSVG